MCGIVGCVIKAQNGFYKQTEDVFYQMLFADTLRGDDSTGMIYVHNNSSFGIVKGAFPAPLVIDSFQEEKEVKAMFNKGKAYIGHNRKKTVGSVSDDTAHPFVVDGTFAMVHNGTLRNHKALADTVVDSEALAIHLSKHLNAEFELAPFEEAIGKVEGAYAISAYNQDTDKVYILRNAERPLSYVETSAGWFWASEMNMLAWILVRNGISPKSEEFKSLPPNTLLTINLSNNKMEVLDYQPKKATPATMKLVAGTKVKSTTHGEVTTISMSKNFFKLLRRKNLGERIFFYADDYVEKNFPKTLADGETEVCLIGENDDFTFKHSVNAVYDINSLPKNAWDLTACYFTGIISDMTFDKSTGWVTVIVDETKTVPKSSKNVIDATVIAKKLAEQEDAHAKQQREQQNETTTTLH
jgi:predicted glutamine amidotransferase